VDQEAYAADAFRVLTNIACITCHGIGPLPGGNPPQTQGPNLELSWQRLRPEWTARWLANPDRMISYATPMPANFPRTLDPYPQFHGSILEQALAVRDILMFFPKVVDMPANRFYRPLTVGETK